MDDALANKDVRQLLDLGGIYLLVVCLQGVLKYGLNMLKGVATENIARDLRLRILKMARDPERQAGESGSGLNPGTVVSMLAAETEDISGFGGDAFGLPLLAGTTIIYVSAYLLWVEPAIALLAIIIYFPQAVIVPLTQFTINRLARLRIRAVRHLGHVAVLPRQVRSDAGVVQAGSGLINRIYRLRILIYLRKYLLAALGNFLDSLGVIIVLVVGGYLVIQGETTVGTLLVFISGLGKIADPWDQLINYYRLVSNTAVMYDMIRVKIEDKVMSPAKVVDAA
ncbi:MAG: hypothetical protein JNL61_13070 [Rhizobiaceae bacterium]|nr:hypothetical protein [Rhizobiaceae bacterium]